MPRQPILYIPGVAGWPKSELATKITDVIHTHGGAIGQLMEDYCITAAMPSERHARTCAAELYAKIAVIAFIEVCYDE